MQDQLARLLRIYENRYGTERVQRLRRKRLPHYKLPMTTQYHPHPIQHHHNN